MLCWTCVIRWPREDAMADNEGVRRRDVLKGIGLTGAAAGLVTTNVAPVAKEAQPQPASQSHAHAPAPARNDNTADAFRFFTAPEAAVVVALVDTLIPKDDVGPGGVEVGVPTFIDREMASAYGRGARMYLDGPFGEGTPQQGYQLPLPPAELYRVGIADLNAWCAKTRGGKTFDQLSAADTNLSIVVLERGAPRDTNPDFMYPTVHDELRYAQRHELMQNVSRETLTFRNTASETALPMRQLGSFLPGEGVGGAGVHWNGATWRWLPWDQEPLKLTLARYGRAA